MRLLPKKIVLTALFAFIGLNAYALPLGNPADPALYCQGVVGDFFANDGCCDNDCNPCGGWNCWDFISFRFGYYGDFVFQDHKKKLLFLKVILTMCQSLPMQVYWFSTYANGWMYLQY